MAYSVTYTPTDKTADWTLVQGRKYFTVEIEQAEVDPAVDAEHEWSLDVPEYIEILEYSVEVTNDAGGTVTGVTPELGVATGWTSDTLNHRVTLTPSPASTYAASYERPAFSVPGGTLYGRPVPNTSGGTIKTRITFAEGSR